MNLSYDILIVDDVAENLKVAMNVLRENNYNFSFATNGREALKIVKKKNFDLILLDIMMPELSGYDVIQELKKDADTRDVPVIFLSAKADVDSLAKGFELGAVDYISKPFHPSELLARVSMHLELHHARETLKQNNINLDVKMKKYEQRVNSEMELNQKEIITLLTELMASTSDETGKHLRRVAEYSKLLATLHESLSAEDSKVIGDASPMHDIGKVTIPHDILHKKGALSEEEFTVMKTHTTNAHNFLNKSKRKLTYAADVIAHQHHEKWDGTGYPQQLKGEEIHIYGRIVALADVLDALTHERVYKKAWSFEKASEYIIAHNATHFDPALVTLFEDNLEKFKAVLEAE